ncbi:thioredoxin domain-containing protein [soil metagenome]
MALAEQMRKDREKAARRQRSVITIGIVVVVLIIGGVAAFAIRKAVNDNAKSDLPYAAPRNTVENGMGILFDAEAAGGTLTAGTTPVNVTIHEDLQCPSCQAFFGTNGAFLDGLVASGDITVTYMPVAFLDRASTDRYSSRSLNAAACVLDNTDVTTFRKFTDLLYANQPAEGGAGLTDAELADYAEQAGAPGLTTCIKKENFAPWVEKVTQKFNDDEIGGTPSIFIDGKKVEGPTQNGNSTQPGQAELQAAIDAAKKA